MQFYMETEIPSASQSGRIAILLAAGADTK